MSKKIYTTGHENNIEMTEEEKLEVQLHQEESIKRQTEALEKKYEDRRKVVYSKTLEPLEDRVVIYADVPNVKTDGGLYLPESAIEKEKPRSGTVVAIGPGKDNALLETLKNIYKLMYREKEFSIKPLDLITQLTDDSALEMARNTPTTFVPSNNDIKVSSVLDGLPSPSDTPEPIKLNIGDRVLYSPYAGTDLKENGVEYLILRYSDIFIRTGKDENA